MKIYKFVSVEFTDDPNVVGRTYWYLCEIDGVEVGSVVVAPIGSHNKLQMAVVRRVMFTTEPYAPYSLSAIKKIDGIVQQKI